MQAVQSTQKNIESKNNIIKDFFSLDIQHKEKFIQIEMHMFTDIVNTCDIPDTYPILKTLLPAVLRSTCYNEDNLPFAVEVLKTEIGHLFEHIILENLCKIKLEKGFKKVEFCGETSWNWKIDPKGTFHITIGLYPEDRVFFPQALERSITLIELVLGSTPKTKIDNQTFNYRFLEQFVKV